MFEGIVELPLKSELLEAKIPERKIKQLTLTQHPVLLFPMHLLNNRAKETDKKQKVKRQISRVELQAVE